MFLQSKATFCTQPYLQEIEAEKDTFSCLLVTYIIKQYCLCVTLTEKWKKKVIVVFTLYFCLFNCYVDFFLLLLRLSGFISLEMIRLVLAVISTNWNPKWLVCLCNSLYFSFVWVFSKSTLELLYIINKYLLPSSMFANWLLQDKHEAQRTSV